MDTPSAWADTPSTSERIVSAIARIAGVLRAGSWQFATAEGLYPIQIEILELLSSRAEPVRLSWLARQLGVTAASASDSVSSLVAKGLVEKGKALDDGRAVALRLSERGRELAAKSREAMSFAHQAVDRLPADVKASLFGSLIGMIEQLQRSERFPEIRACVTCKHFWENAYDDEQAPHHCRLVDKPLPKALLRLDCPEHVATGAAQVMKHFK